ncbi:MAG: hypothetical protein V8Q84_06655 [Bilophila sp.]
MLEQLPDLSEGRPVALHPYATHPDKAWKEDHWTELMGRLEDGGCAVNRHRARQGNGWHPCRPGLFRPDILAGNLRPFAGMPGP